MNTKYTVEIPEYYLLTLAVHGNMGDGELPKIMRMWAENECIRLGLTEKYRSMQNEKLNQLTLRLKNVLGDQAVDGIKSEIRKAVKKLTTP